MTDNDIRLLRLECVCTNTTCIICQAANHLQQLTAEIKALRAEVQRLTT